jgi:hypothetical protein
VKDGKLRTVRAVPFVVPDDSVIDDESNAETAPKSNLERIGPDGSMYRWIPDDSHGMWYELKPNATMYDNYGNSDGDLVFNRKQGVREDYVPMRNADGSRIYVPGALYDPHTGNMVDVEDLLVELNRSTNGMAADLAASVQGGRDPEATLDKIQAELDRIGDQVSMLEDFAKEKNLDPAERKGLDKELKRTKALMVDIEQRIKTEARNAKESSERAEKAAKERLGDALNSVGKLLLKEAAKQMHALAEKNARENTPTDQSTGGGAAAQGGECESICAVLKRKAAGYLDTQGNPKAEQALATLQQRSQELNCGC